MRAHVFRLEALSDSQFRGILAIFALNPPQVWHRLIAVGDQANNTDYPLSAQEAVTLDAELEGLTPGQTGVDESSTVLGQMLADASVVPTDVSVTYLGAREYPTVFPTPPLWSLAERVERWYKEHRRDELGLTLDGFRNQPAQPRS